ncbi:beta-mannosidase [Cerasicoccus maritimus]|uniref:beta-mannosidase n=1 Tax=Cerasicoccus maritimus TaxID=490089 RepID=UPI0028526E1E|nr:glycoside hydrolase family 2 protein [Cerasicoccus maritimus]
MPKHLLLNQANELNDGWQFRAAHNQEWLDAKVPGCVHTDLRNQGVISDPFYGRNEDDLLWVEETDWQYRATFCLSDAQRAEDFVELVAEGLDTFATIKLNGQDIAQTDNMFVGWRFDVKDKLVSGENLLEIDFLHPRSAILARNPNPERCIGDRLGGRTEIRKQQCSFGWDWGPRLGTCGIWRPIRIESWSTNRIEDYFVTQQHSAGQSIVNVAVNTAHRGKRFQVVAKLSLNGEEIAHCAERLNETLQLVVTKPELWQPNGHGEQPLYELIVELWSDGELIDQRSQRIALCEIKLVQEPDEWGQSFKFTVNGKPVFAKGANWIPAHSFVNEGEAHFDDLLDSAVDANMNMIRVWGGGVYELDSFYEACLERGLMVWQDFMFACAPYPGDPAFCKQVRAEAEYQVRRLRNYAHIALWCGNNEIIQLNRDKLKADKKAGKAYLKVFCEVLPKALEKHLPGADYIHTSEYNPHEVFGDTANVDSGDVHFWGVWHARQHFSAYEQQFHRFFSEFGMQAYPHVETAATFTESQNVFSPEFNNHQKNGGGNSIIFHYISELYRFPKDFQATIYLSQIMQAFTLRYGIEHMRRNMPRTMGALYWQLNDCWPVASWSSIDFGGRWKALQYAAKRFFSPALVSVKLIGEEKIHGSTNVVLNGVDAVEIYTVFDGPQNTSGELSWQVWSISQNKLLLEETKAVKLTYGKSIRRKKLDLTPLVEAHGREDLILRTRLTAEGYEDNVNTTCLTGPKRLEFNAPKIKAKVTKVAGGEFDITLSSDQIAYQVYLNLVDAIPHRLSDNFFDLFPGESKTVRLRPLQLMNVAEARKALTIYTYRDSYLT